MTDRLTRDDAETVGRKVVGMVDRLVQAERFVSREATVVTHWPVTIDGQRYRISLKRAAS